MTETLEQRLGEWRQAVRRELKDPHFEREPAYLFEPMRYALQGEGKLLRPLLCLASTEAVGGSWKYALTMAVALEIFHTFTLVHDDIMDGDELRRGSPTVHKQFDLSRALLGGDALLIYMYQVLGEVAADSFPNVYRVFNAGALDVCRGQAYDMQFENADQVDPQDYELMIDLKTGALIKLACELGAILGGADKQTISALGRFGLLLGRAFQMQDDLLEVTSTAQTMGKSLGSDVLNEKKTWIWLDLKQHLSVENLKYLDGLRSVGILRDEDRLELMRWMHAYGTLERAQQKVQLWLAEAETILDSELIQEPSMLKALFDLILTRTR